jgi:hypothetical protein
MINQISNTVFSNSSTAALSQNTAQTLPDINSLVSIQVLDKKGETYKLLISGILFQSKLPFAFSIGEQTIAKVISQNPFSLKLNELLKIQNQTPEKISILLSLLGIENTENNIDFVKELLKNKLSLRKLKINKAIKFIEKSKNHLDELQLNLLVKAYSVEDEYLDYLVDNQNSIFIIPFRDLVKNIFQSVKQLNKDYSTHSITQTINAFLVKDLDLNYNPKESNSFLEEKLLELVSYLVQAIKSNSYEYTINKILTELQKNLIRLIIQSAVYNYFGLFPSFLIVKKNDDLKLIESNSFNETTSNNTNITKFGFKVPTDRLDEIILKGFVTREILYSNVFIKNYNSLFDAELRKTSEEFHFKHCLDAYIGINESDDPERSSIWINGATRKIY